MKAGIQTGKRSLSDLSYIFSIYIIDHIPDGKTKKKKKKKELTRGLENDEHIPILKCFRSHPSSSLFLELEQAAKTQLLVLEKHSNPDQRQ